MNDLADKLNAFGYDATSTSWTLALTEVDCSDERPLVVVGHSLGGRACNWASRKLRGCGKRVPLIIIVDANLIQAIPSNVDRCVHLYVTNELGVFHGSPVRVESPGTQLVNLDVSQGQPSMFLGGVNHFDIDATDWVHDIIIGEIVRRFPPPMALATDRTVATMRRDELFPPPQGQRAAPGARVGSQAQRPTNAAGDRIAHEATWRTAAQVDGVARSTRPTSHRPLQFGAVPSTVNRKIPDEQRRSRPEFARPGAY